MPDLRSCLTTLLTGIALGAVIISAGRLAVLRRRDEAHGLSDALGAGAIGGLVGLATAAVFCNLRAEAGANVSGGLRAWLRQVAPLTGVALIAGAILGALVGIALAWLAGRRGSDDDVVA